MASCCTCGEQCSGLGRCTDCRRPVCFRCYVTIEGTLLGPVLCPECLEKRESQDAFLLEVTSGHEQDHLNREED
jgi:hypothetical protein